MSQKRPNRTASQKKEQYRRAHARAAQSLMHCFKCMEHRGCQRTLLGEALFVALHGAGPIGGKPAGVQVACDVAQASIQTESQEVRLVDNLAASVVCTADMVQDIDGKLSSLFDEVAALQKFVKEAIQQDKETGREAQKPVLPAQQVLEAQKPVFAEVAIANTFNNARRAAPAAAGKLQEPEFRHVLMQANRKFMEISMASEVAAAEEKAAEEKAADIISISSEDDEAEKEDSESATEDVLEKDEEEEEGAKNLIDVRGVSHRGLKVARLCKTFESRTDK